MKWNWVLPRNRVGNDRSILNVVHGQGIGHVGCQPRSRKRHHSPLTTQGNAGDRNTIAELIIGRIFRTCGPRSDFQGPAEDAGKLSETAQGIHAQQGRSHSIAFDHHQVHVQSAGRIRRIGRGDHHRAGVGSNRQVGGTELNNQRALLPFGNLTVTGLTLSQLTLSVTVNSRELTPTFRTENCR